jgi:hypothetical protein
MDLVGKNKMATEKEKIIQDMIEIVGLRSAVLVADYIIARDEKKYGGSIRLELLKENPDYAHIDIDAEYQKAKNWVSGKRVKLTPKFFVDWLNRKPKPLDWTPKTKEQEAF